MTQAEALQALYKSDLELSQVEQEVKKIASQKHASHIKAEIATLKQKVRRVQGLEKDQALEIKEKTDEIKTLYDDLEDLEHKITQEHDSRQVTFLSEKFQQTAKKIEKLEFAVSGSEKEHEKTQNALRGGEKKLGGLIQDLEKTQKEQAHALSILQARAKEAMQRREQFAQLLSQDLLQAYTQAQKRFAGTGVEILQATTPSICRVTLQKSQYDALQRNQETITTCPYCGRLLIKSDCKKDGQE